MKRKYVEPEIKAVKLNPEQAVLQHCSTLAVTLDTNTFLRCNVAPYDCKKSGNTYPTETDYDAYS